MPRRWRSADASHRTGTFLHLPSSTSFAPSPTFPAHQDAQALAQCNRVLQPQGPGQLLTFDSVPAPAPDDVSWPSLWSTGTWEQMVRQVAAVIPLVVFFVIPIGPLQGTCGKKAGCLLVRAGLLACLGLEVSVMNPDSEQ